jgi:hypothetical protein
MRILLGIMIIFGFVGGVLGDLPRSTDEPDGSVVTRGWYRRYLADLELKRQAEAQGNFWKRQPPVNWFINVHASPYLIFRNTYL